jgi:hypothetical protein
MPESSRPGSPSIKRNNARSAESSKEQRQRRQDQRATELDHARQARAIDAGRQRLGHEEQTEHRRGHGTEQVRVHEAGDALLQVDDEVEVQCEAQQAFAAVDQHELLRAVFGAQDLSAQVAQVQQQVREQDQREQLPEREVVRRTFGDRTREHAGDEAREHRRDGDVTEAGDDDRALVGRGRTRERVFAEHRGRNALQRHQRHELPDQMQVVVARVVGLDHRFGQERQREEARDARHEQSGRDR